MKRRRFLQNLGGAALATPVWTRGRTARSSPNEMMVGAMIQPDDAYQKGIGNVLAEMQEVVGINTVMPFSHTHVARQYRPAFAPETNAQGEPVTEVWVRTHARYYTDKRMMGTNPGALFADRDILDELQVESEPRGMQVFARILEPYRITGALGGSEKFAEVDVSGNRTNNVCFNHPGYIRYWHSVVEDLIRSHPKLAGFKFGQERAGPLLAALGKNTPGHCFCQYCLGLARQRGVDARKARAGLIALQTFGNEIRAGHRPSDGKFVTFLRLLMKHPEMLAWERLWMDSRSEQRKRIYQQIKRIRADVQVGWHVDHGMTWDLFMRASWDYRDMVDHSDWLGVALYFDSMGRRSLGHYERNYQTILFGDASEGLSYAMYLSMLGYNPTVEPGPTVQRRHDTAFSTDYVYRECKRVVEAVAGKAKVYARPGFDMPDYDCDVQPKQVYGAATAVLRAGADGVWCGREWRELQSKNKQAFGDALRDWMRKRG